MKLSDIEIRLTFEEYQDVRSALAEAAGALDMAACLSQNERSTINPDGAKNVAATCNAALDRLDVARQRREARRPGAGQDGATVTTETQDQAHWKARAKLKGTWDDPAIIEDPRIDHENPTVRAVAQRLHGNESTHLHEYVSSVICPYCALRTSRVLRWAREHEAGQQMSHDTPFGLVSGQEMSRSD